MSITQTFDLNLIPEQAPVVVHCDQYDEGTGRLIIKLFEGDVAYMPTGTASIQGRKPDGHGFQYSATLVGNTVTADLTFQMSCVSGRVRCQVVVTESTGRTGTFAFILDVQPSALPSDTDLSDSDYQLIEQGIQAAEDAAEAAEDAEAWAVGERGGVPVGPSDPTYENNAEYWSQIAALYAQGAWHYMGSIPFSQLPTSGMVGGDMYNITDDFVTDSRFIEGAGIQCHAGQNVAWAANVSKWDLPVVPQYVPDMSASTKGIGRPDGKTTGVSSGVFFAIGVNTPAEVNSGGTPYGADWLYYAGTTEVITPDADQNYRVTDNGTTKLYFWNGSSYEELTSGGGVTGDYMGLYGMTEIQASDGQGTTLLDLNQYTSVGNYFCDGKAYISTPHYYEIGLNTTASGTHYNAKFILYVRKINDAWILQDLYLVHETGVKRLIHYQRHAEYANNTWTFGIWRADVDTGSVSPDLSPYSLGNGMNNVLVNNIVDGDVLKRVNGKWSNVPINKVTSLAVDLTGWTQDTSSQSGTTLYKKQISLNHVYVESPTVDIGSSGVLPTVAEQESYNLLQYVTVDDTVPCLYLYASAIPTTAFYIKVKGAD